MAKEEVREINPNVHWYSLRDLKNKFPIQNKQWQLNDGATAFEYFYDLLISQITFNEIICKSNFSNISNFSNNTKLDSNLNMNTASTKFDLNERDTLDISISEFEL